jgi:hypothetical protein
VERTVTTVSIVLEVSVLPVVAMTRIALAMMPVSMDNVQILAKELWIVGKLPSAKPQTIDQSAFAHPDLKDLRPESVVSRPDVAVVTIAQLTNGAARDSVSILALFKELVDKMLSVVCSTI